MPLEITQQEREGIQILELKGRLTFGEEDLRLRTELDRLVGEKKTKVVLDLEGLNVIDTTGFETLVFVQETLRDSGGRLALAGLQPSHIDALMKAKLEVVFGFRR
jgi:anti-anti-sigma factor